MCPRPAKPDDQLLLLPVSPARATYQYVKHKTTRAVIYVTYKQKPYRVGFEAISLKKIGDGVM
jgi:hypothetical protein